MKNIYDVEFVSVVDKGQTFTFEQLLSFDENQKILEKFIQEQVNDQKSDLEAKIRNELTAKMQEKLEVTQRELQVKAKEAILAKEKELQEDKARLQASLEVHENSKKQIIEEKDERIKELKDLIAKIQEESKENINAINSQVEKRIEDAVARKTEELTAKRKSAVQIGDLGEQQIMDSLKSLFPTDIIVKPEEHSGGADIDMTIMEGNKEIGSILFEVKNKIA
jgi:exonuclease VII large subunit